MRTTKTSPRIAAVIDWRFYDKTNPSGKTAASLAQRRRCRTHVVFSFDNPAEYDAPDIIRPKGIRLSVIVCVRLAIVWKNRILFVLFGSTHPCTCFSANENAVHNDSCARISVRGGTSIQLDDEDDDDIQSRRRTLLVCWRWNFDPNAFRSGCDVMFACELHFVITTSFSHPYEKGSEWWRERGTAYISWINTRIKAYEHRHRTDITQTHTQTHTWRPDIS